jgi:hypothetical protein
LHNDRIAIILLLFAVAIRKGFENQSVEHAGFRWEGVRVLDLTVSI